MIQLRYIGLFEKLEEAATAYDNAALKYYGRLALLNFPQSK